MQRNCAAIFFIAPMVELFPIGANLYVALFDLICGLKKRAYFGYSINYACAVIKCITSQIGG